MHDLFARIRRAIPFIGFDPAVDPDLDHTNPALDVPAHPKRHRITVHRLVTVSLIGVGGGCGALARAALEFWFPVHGHTIPWTTMAINILGAGLLGALLAWLAFSGPDQGWRRRTRLTLGTGLLGGFTTYSAFSVETVSLIRFGAWRTGLAYALVSVVAGFLAAVIGDRLTDAILKRRAATRVTGVTR